MKTLLKYAWPVLASMALQALLLVPMGAKPGWTGVPIGLFLLVDILVGLMEWIRFKRDRQLQQIVKRLENVHERP